MTNRKVDQIWLRSYIIATKLALGREPTLSETVREFPTVPKTTLWRWLRELGPIVPFGSMA